MTGVTETEVDKAKRVLRVLMDFHKAMTIDNYTDGTEYYKKLKEIFNEN